MSEQPIVPQRPTFESIYLELARRLAERSTCRRLHVGTVIARRESLEVVGIEVLRAK